MSTFHLMGWAMKKTFFFLLIFLLGRVFSAFAGAVPQFQGSLGPVPKKIAQKMKKYSWREGCPVSLDDLSYLKLAHWGLDGKVHIGELIVHRNVALEIFSIFEKIFQEKFPIERMELVDEYKGSDDLSMAANNTSAFNCRSVTGKPGVFSKHSFGRAIDINTRINPYVKGDLVEPKSGRAFLDRSAPKPGMIFENGAVVKSFTEHGWEWGGNWTSLKDYQHFEKKID